MWMDPTMLAKGCQDFTSQDDHIFNIARSINCAQFKNIIAEDFLKALLGLQTGLSGDDYDLLNTHKSSAECSLLYHVCLLSDNVLTKSIDFRHWQLPTLMAKQDEEWLRLQSDIPREDVILPQRFTGQKIPFCPTYNVYMYFKVFLLATPSTANELR